jgi:diketogulonate reductase-like aldo/keto reductase
MSKTDNEELVGIAKAHNKTAAQVLIRYCLQQGWVPLPKSDTPERIQANADVFDFDLTEKEMKVLHDRDPKEESHGALVEKVA